MRPLSYEKAYESEYEKRNLKLEGAKLEGHTRYGISSSSDINGEGVERTASQEHH
jgi:hypothetical protein